jgi:hypothetical protein
MLKTGHFPTVITSKAIEVCVSAERGEYNEQNTTNKTHHYILG